MKNPFARSVRDPAPPAEPVLSLRQQRDREENERFMQKVYAAQGQQDPFVQPPEAPVTAPAAGAAGAATAATAVPATPRPVAVVPATPTVPVAETAPPPASAPVSPAVVELLGIARELLQGREDVESRVVRVLIGRALELLPDERAGH
jgi:hypothetical protein